MAAEAGKRVMIMPPTSSVEDWLSVIYRTYSVSTFMAASGIITEAFSRMETTSR